MGLYGEVTSLFPEYLPGTQGILAYLLETNVSFGFSVCVWVFFRSSLYFYIDVYSVDRQLFQTVGMPHSLRYMVQGNICMCIYVGIETMAMSLLMIVYEFALIYLCMLVCMWLLCVCGVFFYGNFSVHLKKTLLTSSYLSFDLSLRYGWIYCPL